MKKFIAVVLLIAYSFTSIGSVVAIHNCQGKQRFIAQHSTQGCGHSMAATPDCCSANQGACQVKNDENVVDVRLYEQPGAKYPSPAFPFDAAPPIHAQPFSTSLAGSNVPLNIYKLRLHLFKRVLLI